MNKNIRIAKQLVKLAKSIVASSTAEDEYEAAFQKLASKARTEGPSVLASHFSYSDKNVKATIDGGMQITLDFNFDPFDGDVPESDYVKSSTINPYVRDVIRGEKFQNAFNSALYETQMDIEEDWTEWSEAASYAEDLVQSDPQYIAYKDDGMALLSEGFDELMRQEAVFLPKQDVIVKVNGKTVPGNYCWTYNMWGGGAWG